MTGPDDAAAASPATAPPDRWALGVGAGVGVAAVAVELLTGAGGLAARAVAAIGFGLVGGLGGWLVADAVADRTRRRAADTAVRATPAPAWAAPTLVPATGWAVPTRPVPPAWTNEVRRQARVRYVAAGVAAVAGAVAALARLTPDRAGAADAVLVGYPVVAGAVVATAAAAAVYFREAGWKEVFEAWSRRVVPHTDTNDGSAVPPNTPVGSGWEPEETRAVALRDASSPPLPASPPPPRVFDVKLPPEPGND